MKLNKILVRNQLVWRKHILLGMVKKIEIVQPILICEAYFITNGIIEMATEYRPDDFPFNEYNLLASTLVEKLIISNSQIKTDLFEYEINDQQNMLLSIDFRVTLTDLKIIIDKTILNNVIYKTKYDVNEIPDISRIKLTNITEKKALKFLKSYRILSIIADLLPLWKIV